MGIQEELDCLFCEWKRKQQEEKEALPFMRADYFFPDGLVGSEDDWEKASPKVLYVLKESNVRETDDFKFWFKDIAESGKSHWIKRRIKHMQSVVMDKEIMDSGLKDVAYMNVNKSGGLANTNPKQLKAYVTNKAIAPLIRKQIEILVPDIIVCAGCYGLVTEILSGKHASESGQFKGKVINIWHPSYFRVTDECYIEKFKLELKNAK